MKENERDAIVLFALYLALMQTDTRYGANDIRKKKQSRRQNIHDYHNDDDDDDNVERRTTCPTCSTCPTCRCGCGCGCGNTDACQRRGAANGLQRTTDMTRPQIALRNSTRRPQMARHWCFGLTFLLPAYFIVSCSIENTLPNLRNKIEMY